MYRIEEAIIVFSFLEKGENVFVAPADRAKLLPFFIVTGIAADVDHRIDGAAAAQDAGLHHGWLVAIISAIDGVPWNSLEKRALRCLVICSGNMDVGTAVSRAFFEQDDVAIRVFG